MNRIIILALAALILVPAAFSSAQVSTHIVDNTKKEIAWNDMVDQIVDVDGLAWGAFEKGIGPYAVLPRGRVYLKNLDLLNTDFNGRLIRVSGVLRKSRVEPAGKFAQGYSQPFEYFYIEIISASRIDKLEHDQLLPTEHNWIVAGLSADTAAKYIADRNLQPYALSLAAPNDRSTSHSYLVSDGLVLTYRVQDGRVSTVTKIHLNSIGKSDDKRVSVKGFKLPPVQANAR